MEQQTEGVWWVKWVWAGLALFTIAFWYFIGPPIWDGLTSLWRTIAG